MPRFTYQFSIDEIDIINQRSRTGDTDADIVNFWLTSSVDPTDKVSAEPSVIGTFIASGNKFGISVDPANSEGMIPLQLLATLGDADMVQLHASIYNFSHQGDSQRQTADTAKLAAAVLAFVLAGPELFTLTKLSDEFGLKKEDVDRVLGPAKGTFALVAGVLQALGDLLEIFASPNCDGYVFNQEVAQFLSAKFLLERTGGQKGGSFTFEAIDETQHSQSACGADPKTRVVLRVTLVDIEPDPPAPVLGSVRSSKSFRPVVGRSLSAWSGTWGDTGFIESSRVVCILDAPPGSGAGPLELLKSKIQSDSALTKLVGRLPTERDRAVIAVLPPTTTAVNVADGVAKLAPIIKVELTETLGGPGGQVAVKLAHEAALDLPMRTAAFIENVFASEVEKVAPPLGRGPAGGGSIRLVQSLNAAATGNVPIVGGLGGGPSLGGGGQNVPIVGGLGGGPGLGRGGENVPIVGGLGGGDLAAELGVRFADTLAVSDGVCLQAYGGFDDAGFVELRLRYVRVDESGSIVSDVMLQRAQHAPH